MPVLSRIGFLEGRVADGSRNLRLDASSWLNSAPAVAQGLNVQTRAESQAGIFARCSNPRCNSGWLRLWRHRSAPVFEGGWVCSQECTRAQVGKALEREMEARGSGMERRRHRIPIGLTMLEQGWITQEQLREGLRMQKAAGGGRLGHWLVRRQYVTEQTVTRAVGLQWNCPVMPLEFHDHAGLTPLMPRLFLDAFGALPLRVGAAGKILYLGFEDHLDPALALAVERMTGLHVESGLVRESQFRSAHERMLAAKFPSVELVEAASEPAMVYAIARAIERSKPQEARLVRVHECLWLRMWLRPQAGAVPAIDSVKDLICSVGAA